MSFVMSYDSLNFFCDGFLILYLCFTESLNSLVYQSTDVGTDAVLHFIRLRHLTDTENGNSRIIIRRKYISKHKYHFVFPHLKRKNKKD